MGVAEGNFLPVLADDARAMSEHFAANRTAGGPFDLVVAGRPHGDDRAQDAELPAALAAAGATWYVEGRDPWNSTLDQTRARIRQGPPAG